MVRNKNYLSASNLKEIFDAYTKFKTKKGRSYLATTKEIIDKDCLLSIQHYVTKNSLEKIPTIKESIKEWMTSSDDLITSFDNIFENLEEIKNE